MATLHEKPIKFRLKIRQHKSCSAVAYYIYWEEEIEMIAKNTISSIISYIQNLNRNYISKGILSYFIWSLWLETCFYNDQDAKCLSKY